MPASARASASGSGARPSSAARSAQRGGDRRRGARLQLRADAGAHRRGERADLGGQAGRPAGGLAQSRDRLQRLSVLLLPELQGRRRRLDALAAQLALEPVDPPRRGARGAAQVAQQVGCPPGPQHRLQQGDQGSLPPRWWRPGPPPRARSGSRRTRGSRRSAGRAAPGRGRRSRSAPARSPAASRRATSTAIASASPRSPAERRKTRLSSIGRRCGSVAPKPRSRWKRSGESVLPGSAAVSSTESMPISLERLEQRGVARLERRVPGFVGQRHGHLGGRGEAADQAQLVGRQVVEAVEEDRPPPELALGTEQVDRVAGDAVGVDGAEAVPHSRVAGEEGRDVAEVGRALERPGRRFDVGRLRGPPPAARRAGAPAPAESRTAGRSRAAGPAPRAARSPPPRRRRGAAPG